jgi:threonine dehydratase
MGTTALNGCTSPSEIRKAADALKGRVLRTPLVYSSTFSRLCGANVYLKLENLQETGSFKLRGASWKILSNLDKIGPEGVVAASAGNHAQGVALAASRAKLPSTVVMPEWASISKQEATRAYGAEVINEGQNLSDAIRKAGQLVEGGKTLIHPFDDAEVIAGQGTIGIEILEELKEPDLVVVPVGGGGLIAGIACACRSIRPKTRIVGVQAGACPSAYQSLQSGRVVSVEAQKSLADGITVKQVGALPFSIIRELVDGIVLVEEDAIAAAILMLLERKKLLAEGAGAVPLAALMSGVLEVPKGGTVVLVISGGNMDSPLLGRVLRKGLFRNGRIMRFSVCLDDIPGSLSGLLGVVAKVRANVLHIYHNRGARDLPVSMSMVELELETRSPEHIEEVTRELRSRGYRIQFQTFVDGCV